MTNYFNEQYLIGLESIDIEQRKKWLYGQFQQSEESQKNYMDQYKEFCRLRDYRKPGVDVTRHTEAEAFSLATAASNTHDFSALEAFIKDDAYLITCHSIEKYRAMLIAFISSQVKPELKCYLCNGEAKRCTMNCSLGTCDTRQMVDARRECEDCAACHVCANVVLPKAARTNAGLGKSKTATWSTK